MELKPQFFVLFYIVKFYSNFTAARNHFKIEYTWAQIEFDFKSDAEREESINNGTFNVGMVQPIDVQVYYPDSNNATKQVFITCPRMDGTPATLGIVTDKKRGVNPIVAPYPNWEWQTNPKMCKKERIVSVYRVIIDECKRLWVLDNGKIGDDQVCPPQILAFDLKTNDLIRQYEIPFNQHLNTSLYLTPVVDSNNSTSCEDAFVYNADASGFSLLVYDVKNNKSWRIIDKTFYPDPRYGTYKIDGETFELMDGILGLALSPPSNNRKLFYHAMSSATENWVYTKHLKNESLFSSALSAPQIFHTYPKRRKTQSAAEGMDKSGNLYFSLLGDIKIASWNIEKPYDYRYFRKVGDNKTTMQFPSGMKVIARKNGQEDLWIFATAYQRLASGKLFSNQTNFIISSARVKDLQSDWSKKPDF